jgi:hypothetical protein
MVRIREDKLRSIAMRPGDLFIYEYDRYGRSCRTLSFILESANDMIACDGRLFVSFDHGMSWTFNSTWRWLTSDHMDNLFGDIDVEQITVMRVSLEGVELWERRR